MVPGCRGLVSYARSEPATKATPALASAGRACSVKAGTLPSRALPRRSKTGMLRMGNVLLDPSGRSPGGRPPPVSAYWPNVATIYASIGRIIPNNRARIYVGLPIELGSHRGYAPPTYDHFIGAPFPRTFICNPSSSPSYLPRTPRGAIRMPNMRVSNPNRGSSSRTCRRSLLPFPTPPPPDPAG